VTQFGKAYSKIGNAAYENLNEELGDSINGTNLNTKQIN
jgi:hypothetical protein